MEGAADVLAPEGIAALASFVIRPPRASYSRRDLGEKSFILDDVPCSRTDLELTNTRGLTLQCSYFQPSHIKDPTPAVVYLHGNGSCRVEATMLLQYVLPYGISMFAFDFSGSGRSGGEYITLGVHEKDDVATVVGHLIHERQCPRVALWGHSMGAATALMYAGLCCDSPKVSAIIVDSAFQSFEKLAEAMVSEMPLPSVIPRNIVLTIGVRAVRRNVRERANFDVHHIDPLGAVKKLRADTAPPAFFLHGMLDSIVPPSHSTTLFSSYPGNKTVRYLPGLQHDSPRPDDVLEGIFEFLQRSLSPGGARGTQYLTQLKARGNLCMLSGRYSDASYLYSAALDALAITYTGVDFATATGSVDPRSKPPTGRNVQRRRTNTRAYLSPRASTASSTQKKRRWRARFVRLSNNGAPGTVLSDAGIAGTTSSVPDFDDGGESGMSTASGFGGFGSTSPPLKSARARSFLQGIKARISRGQDGSQRRTRSGRFSTRMSGFTDRRDEFRSLGSGNDGVSNRGVAESPSGSRRVSHDTSGVLIRESVEDDEAGPRKSIRRFRRLSQSPSIGRLGEHVNNNGIGMRGRGLARFSHDNWRMRRGGRNRGNNGRESNVNSVNGVPEDSNSTLDGGNGNGGGDGGARRPPRSASVDLHVASEALAADAANRDQRPREHPVTREDMSHWGMSSEKKSVALALLGNRSLARRKLGDNNAALLDAVLCLRLDPLWMRGYLRKAAALRQSGKLEAALAAVTDGLRVDPTHVQLSQLHDEISKGIESQKIVDKPDTEDPAQNVESGNDMNSEDLPVDIVGNDSWNAQTFSTSEPLTAVAN